MWFVTTLGFLSVVEHRDNDDFVLVRGRIRADVEWVSRWVDAELRHDPSADYPWRTTVPKSEFVEWLIRRAFEIDYDNFKDAVVRSQGPERAAIYGEVWATFQKLERLSGPRRLS